MNIDALIVALLFATYKVYKKEALHLPLQSRVGPDIRSSDRSDI